MCLKLCLKNVLKPTRYWYCVMLIEMKDVHPEISLVSQMNSEFLNIAEKGNLHCRNIQLHYIDVQVIKDRIKEGNFENMI
jgi:hypothetical protein